MWAGIAGFFAALPKMMEGGAKLVALISGLIEKATDFFEMRKFESEMKVRIEKSKLDKNTSGLEDFFRNGGFE